MHKSKYMKKLFCIPIDNFNKSSLSNHLKIARSVVVLLAGSFLLHFQEAISGEVFLKCTGKYEINRGPLIKPDWVTSYLKVNLNGSISTINDKGDTKKGTTLIRNNYYTIIHRDNRNRIKNIYKINRTHGTYLFESPQSNRALIGTCEKSRG